MGWLKYAKKKEDYTGIEPVTYRSAVSCSTTELIVLTCIPTSTEGFNTQNWRSTAHQEKQFDQESTAYSVMHTEIIATNISILRKSFERFPKQHISTLLLAR